MLVIYRQRSEHRQTVEEFIRQFKGQYPDAKMEILDVDQREGIAIASLYDVTRYPAILALRDDGSALQVWQGQEEMPRLDDVSYYASGQV